MRGYRGMEWGGSSQKADAFTIPIFALSANAFIEDRKKTKEAGMNEHLAKPLDMNALFQMIRKYTR